MTQLSTCGNCRSIEVMPGLNTIQCLQCGYVTHLDGRVVSADERFTKTIHQKHKELDARNEVPVEG